MALAIPLIKQVKPEVMAVTNCPKPSILFAIFLAVPRLTPFTVFLIPVIVLVIVFNFPEMISAKVSPKP